MQGVSFHGLRQLQKQAPQTGWQENNLEDLLNFSFPGTDSGIEKQFGVAPVYIPWKWKSEAQSVRPGHRSLRRKRRIKALRFARQTVVRNYFESEK